MKPSQPKKITKPREVQAISVQVILGKLKQHQSEAKLDKSMRGEFREGYLMGLSDAIEDIQDMPISRS